MIKTLRFILVLICFSSVAFISVFCNRSNEQKTSSSPYLNHSQQVKYVGMNTCKKCHVDIYETFINTGMGKSFDHAGKHKSAAKMDVHTVVYDKFSDFYYHPQWTGDSLQILEFRLEGKDTTYKRLHTVNYIIGSGQHTNSHLFQINGYLRQMPLTFYTQKGEWDLPPGFENGFNTRFSRLIGIECMTCHNSFPDFIEGSENKYASLPNGIGCERCHGPGEIHVKEKMAGNIVDTSKYIDYSIVNPGKLPIDLQFDVCQRCHLQGNAVLKNDHNFYDFKPGKNLSDYMTVFLPKYKGAEDEFIMASHADRLKMSRCFLKSFIPSKSDDKLKPYKQSITCVTCHNPHVSVKQTRNEVFNNACKNCHAASKNQNECSEQLTNRIKTNKDNCFSCHMPKSNTLDIPHVTTTDHFIRIPLKAKDKKATKEFIGLYAINEINPAPEVICEAYINQYEKFDNNPMLLDSAEKYCKDKTWKEINRNFDLLVRLQFCKLNYKRVIEYAEKFGKEILLRERNPVMKKSQDNKNAWTLYRIGESYSNLQNLGDAILFYERACNLAPYHNEFQNKLAAALLSYGKTVDAQKILEKLVVQDPTFAEALSNYGYSFLLQNNIDQADRYFTMALNQDPDLETALLNKAGVLIYRKNIIQAKKILQHVLKKNPQCERAKIILLQL